MSSVMRTLAERLRRENAALRAQVERLQAERGQVVAPTVEAAHEMGAHGGPVVEAERLAFEGWMAGHCWKVSPTWNGREYDDSEGDKKRKLLDPLARTTRMLWAAWRDRAALAAQPARVAMTDFEIDAMADRVFKDHMNHQNDDYDRAFARAVERHHGITPGDESPHVSNL